jgi:hypothetical protein
MQREKKVMVIVVGKVKVSVMHDRTDDEEEERRKK